jgi:hypothetical protein
LLSVKSGTNKYKTAKAGNGRRVGMKGKLGRGDGKRKMGRYTVSGKGRKTGNSSRG